MNTRVTVEIKESNYALLVKELTGFTQRKIYNAVFTYGIDRSELESISQLSLLSAIRKWNVKKRKNIKFESFYGFRFDNDVRNFLIENTRSLTSLEEISPCEGCVRSCSNKVKKACEQYKHFSKCESIRNESPQVEQNMLDRLAESDHYKKVYEHLKSHEKYREIILLLEEAEVHNANNLMNYVVTKMQDKYNYSDKYAYLVIQNFRKIALAADKRFE